MEETSRSSEGYSGAPAGEGGFRGGRGRGDKRFVFRKKECYFTKNNITYIDYKDVELLKRYVGKNGAILPRRFTGTSPKAQRQLSLAIKRARSLAMLPFAGEVERPPRRDFRDAAPGAPAGAPAMAPAAAAPVVNPAPAAPAAPAAE